MNVHSKLSLVPAAAATLALAISGCSRPAAPASTSTAPVPATAEPPRGQYVPPLANPVPVAGAADVASLVERLKPTVVNITTTSKATPARDQGPFPFPFPFGPFPGGGGPQGGPPGFSPRAVALGTGFIIDPAGYVITNAHVVEDADDIKVKLADEREFPAKVVGKDAKLDVALLKIDGASNLSAAVLGDSDKLRVGEWVIAIGNPFGLGHTVTLGIVSAKDRTIGAGPYDAFIQTDASINPGNSGGALFNLKGEVVGVPTAIRQGAQGIGFAVPVNSVADVIPQLREKGAVSRGKLGVRIQHVTADLAKGLGLDHPRGALVASVEPNGAGARAGIEAGDVITKVDGADVPHSEELPRMVARHQPGAKVTLTVLRDGKEKQVSAVLDALVDQDDDETSPASQKGGLGMPTQPQGKLGVQLEDVQGGGAKIRGVMPDSPAFGQLMPGDVVVEVNHQPVKSAADFAKKIEATKGGQVALMRVKRGQDQRFVAITLK